MSAHSKSRRSFFWTNFLAGRNVKTMKPDWLQIEPSINELSGLMTCLALIFTFCLATFVIGCKTGSRSISSFANDLRHSIPPGWNISTSNNVVRIRSEAELTLIIQMQLPVSADSIDEVLRKYGEKEKYEVALSFVPRLSDSELEHLHEARRPYEQALHGNSMTSVSQSLWALDRIPLPTYYTDDYSIFVVRPLLNGGYEDYPAARQVEQLMDSLKAGFHEY